MSYTFLGNFEGQEGKITHQHSSNFKPRRGKYVKGETIFYVTATKSLKNPEIKMINRCVLFLNCET
jgi:hypothetical protein